MNIEHFNHPLLTERFEQAFHYAMKLHSDQTRKGTEVPYIAHLLGVTSLVLEDGGDEDQAIAALLHDAVEDQGGLIILEEIHLNFGENVAQIVEGCSDSFTSVKPPWRLRKESYLEHLMNASKDIRRVSLADKLYNARAIWSTYRQIGEETWTRFKGGKEGTLWYFTALCEIFQQTGDDIMTEELVSVVANIKQMSC